MDPITITLILLLVVAVIFGLYVISARNRIIRLDNQIENAWGQIDVQLKRRADLIPNLVETVKGYAKHEKGVIDGVSQARAAMVAAKGPVEKMDANNQLGAALGRLFAISEAYPDLKANQNFLALQEELTATEGRVAYARQFYNDSVLDYNNRIQQFPGSSFAGSLKMDTREYFEADEAARTVPTVEF